MLIEGDAGWGEWSPFLEYPPTSPSPGCAAPRRRRPATGRWPCATPYPVNATVPVISPEAARDRRRARAARPPRSRSPTRGRRSPTTWPGSRRCATRWVRRARSASTPTARGRSTRRLRAIGVLDRAAGGLEYVEQPCASVEDLAVVRRRVAVPIAADESIRRAADPYRVRDLEAADIAVLKVQPLGGVRACLRIAEDIGLPVVVSSALETSLGPRRRASRWQRPCPARARLRPGDPVAAHRRRRLPGAAAAGRRDAAGGAAARGPDALADAVAAAPERVARWEERLAAVRAVREDRRP